MTTTHDPRSTPPVGMPCPGGTGPLAHYGGRPCCPALVQSWPPAPLPAHWPLYAAGGHTLALSHAQAVRHMVASGMQA